MSVKQDKPYLGITNCLVFFVIKLHWNIKKISLVSIASFEMASNPMGDGNGDWVTMWESLERLVPMASDLLSFLFNATRIKALAPWLARSQSSRHVSYCTAFSKGPFSEQGAETEKWVITTGFCMQGHGLFF